MGVCTYCLWRISDDLPDILFRLTEIQKDIADLKKSVTEDDSEKEPKNNEKRGRRIFYSSKTSSLILDPDTQNNLQAKV